MLILEFFKLLSSNNLSLGASIKEVHTKGGQVRVRQKWTHVDGGGGGGGGGGRGQSYKCRRLQNVLLLN